MQRHVPDRQQRFRAGEGQGAGAAETAARTTAFSDARSYGGTALLARHGDTAALRPAPRPVFRRARAPTQRASSMQYVRHTSAAR
jgi:hypothetical protein